MKIFDRISCYCFCIMLFFLMPAITNAEKMATAIFAAGCFWCAEHDFEQVPGIIKVISGYTGGKVINPTYAQVSQGGTGHFESIEVYYNPKKVSYAQLLNVFWHNIDPTDAKGQFCDKGDQYRSVIFYSNNEEKQLALASKDKLLHSGHFKNIATLILPTSTFYPAEEYHQKYALKNPLRYNFYRYNCGRDKRLEQILSLLPSIL